MYWTNERIDPAAAMGLARAVLARLRDQAPAVCRMSFTFHVCPWGRFKFLGCVSYAPTVTCIPDDLQTRLQ